MNSLETKLAELSTESRGWLLGTKSENPLGCAFTKKRVVHPGAGGKRMIMDKAEQAQVWAELMAQTPDPADERAAYIHIPFCDKKCSYCGFFQNYTKEEAAHRYVDVLLQELDAAAETPYVQGAPFQAVFFGGGTPTALSDADLARLVRAVRERLPLTSDAEITLEGRIHDLTESKVEAAMRAGALTTAKRSSRHCAAWWRSRARSSSPTSSTGCPISPRRSGRTTCARSSRSASRAATSIS